MARTARPPRTPWPPAAKAAGPPPTAPPPPAPSASPTPTPTPAGSAGPTAGATYAGETSQGLLVEFDVTADAAAIGRVKFGFDGELNGEPCQGLMNMTFGQPKPIR